jgi:hypothetical protein
MPRDIDALATLECNLLHILLLGGYAIIHSTAYSFPLQQLFVGEGIRCFPRSQVADTTEWLVNMLLSFLKLQSVLVE